MLNFHNNSFSNSFVYIYIYIFRVTAAPQNNRTEIKLKPRYYSLTKMC